MSLLFMYQSTILKNLIIILFSQRKKQMKTKIY